LATLNSSPRRNSVHEGYIYGSILSAITQGVKSHDELEKRYQTWSNAQFQNYLLYVSAACTCYYKSIKRKNIMKRILVLLFCLHLLVASPFQLLAQEGPLTFEQMVAQAMEEVALITPEEAQRRIEQDPNLLVIDVQDAADIAAVGTIPGAVNISLGSLTYKADNEVPEDWRDPRLQDRSRPIITTCALGPMGALGGKLLQDMGFTNVTYLEGGSQAWMDAGFPMVDQQDDQDEPATGLTVLQINFGFEMTPAEYEAAVTPLVEPISEVDGLMWKVWVINEENQEAGGIYLFEDADSLNAYLGSEIVATLMSFEGNGLNNIEAKVFDVMENLSAITHAPLTR
jgi:rhodanese-related sulfurtransferase